MNAKVQELHPVGAETKIAEYSATAAALGELSSRYKAVVFDVTTKAGMEAAKAARKELRDLRVALEEKRKELKAPALERARLIDDEAKEIKEAIVELEQPIAAQIEVEEKRAEREKEERIKAEAARVSALQARVQDIRNLPSRQVGRGAAAIGEALAAARAMTIGEDFAEFQREAQAELTIAIASLTSMHSGALAQEAEAAKIAEERAELDRLRREAAERAAKEEAERRARIEAEERAAREARAREEAEARAERERLDREAADARAAQQKALDDEIASRREARHFDKVMAGQAPVGSAPEAGLPVGETGDELGAAIAVVGSSARERIYFDALIALQEIVMPGSDEAAIIERALRAAEEV